MSTKFIAILISLVLLLAVFTGCSKNETSPPEPTITLPLLTTDLISSITLHTASCTGTITSDGGSAVTHRGICWSKAPDPLISDSTIDAGTGTGTFTGELTGLDTSTLYYARAYATNSKGTGYGNTLSFTTEKEVVYGSVTDVDGNKYPIVKIGSQYWLQKNLSVTHYRNGDVIPKVTVDNQWKVLVTGAYCLYDNLKGTDPVYGNLYNWYAVNDARGICPEGWHVASNPDWDKMGEFLGGLNVAGGALKSTGTLEQSTGLWYAPNTGATNSSAFHGLPGGTRFNYGSFYSIGNLGNFWSISDTNTANAWNYILDANNETLGRNYNFKAFGFSVRCCKD
jgi:uncharacterized protein (TIGR02145 family)